MSELEHTDVYACALPMPTPSKPRCAEWSAEISRVVERDPDDEIYLIGHSLGATAILRYLEECPWSIHIKGVVLVSGPVESIGEKEAESFFQDPFEFSVIRQRVSRFAVIHGDDDDVVPFEHAQYLAEKLDAELVTVKGGGHLKGSSGWYRLPEAVEALERMFD